MIPLPGAQNPMPYFAETERILAAVRCQLVASGGVSTAEDVRRLAQMPGLYGCIIGKALYDDKLRLADVLSRNVQSSTLT